MLFVSKLLFPNLSYQIRGACFEVYNALGPGHKESVIEKALIRELQLRNLIVENQKNISIHYKGKKVGSYIPDIIVNNKIIIELKAKPVFVKSDIKQFWYYLKASPYHLGFLINFGPKLTIMRRINSKKLID